MSKIGNYVVELQELTDSVMALDPQHLRFGTNHKFSYIALGCQCTYCDFTAGHADACPVIKLREVLIKQGSKV